MQGRMNIPTRGGGGGDLSLNVFAQAAEPTTKDGIWINTSASGSLPLITKFEYDGIEIANADFRNASNGDKVYLPNPLIPYGFYQGSAVAVGTDIYLFGGSGSYTTAYKYNPTTNTYTKLTNIPYSFYYGAAVAVGTDIYLFGSASSGYYTTAYKYNTTANTYTQLPNIPYNFYRGSAAAAGTDIYLLGGSGSSSYTTAYKYNTTTNTYTQLTDIPYNFYRGSAVAVGTDIYLFGSYSSGYYKTAYKYVDLQLKNNFIYLFAVYAAFETQISNNLNIPVFYAQLCKDNALKAYPAYYGDGTQWNRLPD